MLRLLRRTLSESVRVSLTDGFSQVGGGALPLLELPTKLLSIAVEGISANSLEARLRNFSVPVLGRIQSDLFLLDLRTILDPDIPVIVSALVAIIGEKAEG